MVRHPYVYRVILLLALAVASVIAACGGDDPAGPPGGNNPPASYALVIGGDDDDTASDVVVTASGERIVVGQFIDTLHVTGLPDTLIAPSLNVYLTAFRADGSLAWVNQFGDDANDVPNAITSDGADLYVTGGYTEAGQSQSTFFVTKLNSTGDPVWKMDAASDWNDFGTDVIPDGAGGVYVTGAVGAPITLGGKPVGYEDGREVGFVARIDGPTSATWAETGLVPDGTSVCSGVARASDGSVFIGGSYFETDLWFGGTTIGNDGLNDSFIAHYGELGTPLGIARIGGDGDAQVRGIVWTSAGPVVVGVFSGNVDFDVVTAAGAASSAGGGDAFVAAYTNAGALRWAKVFGATGDDESTHICRIGANDVLVGGTFDGTVTFGTKTLITNGGTDIFALRLDNTGTVNWADGMGSTDPEFLGVVAAAGDQAIIAGGVAGDATFPDGSTRPGFGLMDGFIYQR